MPLAKQIMILSKEGLLLLAHRFHGSEGLQMDTDPDLLSGMLSAILAVAKETTGGLVKTIQQNNYKVLVSEGEHIYVLLFIDEESRELDNIAKMIVKRFESRFQEELSYIVSDINAYQPFIEDLDEIHAQTFKVDAELLSNLIPEVSNIKNVSIFEKPMNHQVYTGPKDSLVSGYEHYLQDFALNFIESQSKLSEETLLFPVRTVIEFKNKSFVLEDLGSHVLTIVGENPEEILVRMKKIRKKLGIPSK